MRRGLAKTEMPFKRRLKCPNSMWGCRNEAGRLFQILGPAAEKLLSPSLVCVRGTVCRVCVYCMDG